MGNNSKGAEVKLKKKLEKKGRYDISVLLGTGGNATVYSAIDKEDSEKQVALKVFQLKNRRLEKNFVEEVSVLISLKGCANIIEIRDHYKVVLKLDGRKFKYGVIVLPKMQTDLMEVILNIPLTINSAREVFRKLCNAVEAMHLLNIAHLDLKADNVMVKTNENQEVEDLVLIDFGSSKKFEEFDPAYRFGTQQYLPFEYFTREFPLLPEKADIWALGIILFTMITRSFPFRYNEATSSFNCIDLSVIKKFCRNDNDNDSFKIFSEIQRSDTNLTESSSGSGSGSGSVDNDNNQQDSNNNTCNNNNMDEIDEECQNCYELLKWIFSDNPEDRPTISQILSHPWLTFPLRKQKKKRKLSFLSKLRRNLLSSSDISLSSSFQQQHHGYNNNNGSGANNNNNNNGIHGGFVVNNTNSHNSSDDTDSDLSSTVKKKKKLRSSSWVGLSKPSGNRDDDDDNNHHPRNSPPEGSKKRKSSLKTFFNFV